MQDNSIKIDTVWLSLICESYLTKFGAQPLSLARLFTFATQHNAVIPPHDIHVFCEQGRTDRPSTGCDVETLRLVVTDTDDHQHHGVTRGFYLADLTVGPKDVRRLAIKVERLVADAEQLIGQLRAMKVGTARIDGEIDYSDPRNLTDLLENRGCTILQHAALEHLVKVDPGPLFYGDIDLCEDGGSWEQTGGPWATRIEDHLVKLGAARRDPEPSAPAASHSLPKQVKDALEGDSNDAEHDALVSVAEHLGIDWTPPDE
jgi:hypothetical protein